MISVTFNVCALFRFMCCGARRCWENEVKRGGPGGKRWGGGGGGVRIQIVLKIVTTFDIHRPAYDYNRILHKFMTTK